MLITGPCSRAASPRRWDGCPGRLLAFSVPPRRFACELNTCDEFRRNLREIFGVWYSQTMRRVKLKSDRYRSARGGSAQLLTISCSSCRSFVLLYQKDGPGQLLRCYLNRIFEPERLARLQYANIRKSSNLKPLVCENCGQLLATGMKHTDNRLAYRLVPGAVVKSVVK